jgi:hypothetical protein
VHRKQRLRGVIEFGQARLFAVDLHGNWLLRIKAARAQKVGNKALCVCSNRRRTSNDSQSLSFCKMEKQVRQATQRFPAAPVRSSSVADTRMLAVSESRRAINEAAGGPEETVPVALSPSGDVPLPQFDALEVLGPSLSDVLTFVNPPMPRSLQEEQLQQQAAGEDTQGESNLTVPEAAETPAKFDVCLSRSVVLGKVVDASVDNSRRTQEYFAKLLDKLQLDATGLVLLLVF